MLTKEEILQRLTGTEPISLVRIGDGESIVLNSMSSVSSLQLANVAVLQRQLGYNPSVNDIEAIRNNLIEAYTHADIIGIPNHRQRTNAHWSKVVEILNANVPTHTDNYCDIDVGYQFLDNGGYDTLLQDRRDLNYISCRDLDKGFKKKWNIKTVNKFIISPEMKFTSGYNGEHHYPTQFNKISRWMDCRNTEGELLLVGAGVVGKIYCNWWRDRGGIAFDVGAVLDVWAGKVTRGPERGLDKEEESKYKL